MLPADEPLPDSSDGDRAQLLTRRVRRTPSLAGSEQESLLGGLAAIEAAARELAVRVDALDRAVSPGVVGHNGSSGAPPAALGDG